MLFDAKKNKHMADNKASQTRQLARGVSLRPSEADDKFLRRLKLSLAKYMVSIPSPREIEQRRILKKALSEQTRVPVPEPQVPVAEIAEKEEEEEREEEQSAEQGPSQQAGLPSVEEILAEVPQEVGQGGPAGQFAKLAIPAVDKRKKKKVNWRVEPLTALMEILKDDFLIAKLQDEVDALTMQIYRLWRDTRDLFS